MSLESQHYRKRKAVDNLNDILETTRPTLREEGHGILKVAAPADELDNYCKICDDGGNLIQCTECGFHYCYDDYPVAYDNDSLTRGCVTLPEGYLNDPLKVFYCPSCLTEHPHLPLDYHINRGFNSTQRRVINFQVIIILSYLPYLEERATRIYEGIRGLLGSLEIVVSVLHLALPETLHKDNINWVLELNNPYHLVYMFVTESNPGGGWWISPEAQTDEGQWLMKLVGCYSEIANKAVTARIFGLCCGLNLTEKHTIPAILGGLNESQWDSMVLPTASSVQPEEYATIFPELFGQLYYNGITLTSAIIRVWGTSRRARVHTDLLIIEDLKTQPIVKKYRYGSLTGRPYGVILPGSWTFCACARSGVNTAWEHKHGAKKIRFGEHLTRFRTSCGHAHLDLAVYVGNAQVTQAAGVQIIKEDFDLERGMFPLDSSDSFAMRVRLALGPGPCLGDEHTSAWTRFGKDSNVNDAGFR